jgi:predicted GNAT family N-acyltransferase
MEPIEIKKDELLYKQALELRYRLFFEEHGLPKSILCDSAEDRSRHFAITRNSDLNGYGRLTKRSHSEFQISQLVVSPRCQSQGLGTSLLKKLIEIAKKDGAKTVVLEARTTAIGLYEKLGFQQVGKVYNSSSTGVPHIKMKYRVQT